MRVPQPGGRAGLLTIDAGRLTTYKFEKLEVWELALDYMIDRERVERLVFLIRDAVRELQVLNLEGMGLEAYRADKQTRALSEHYLRIAIEATLDLGRHATVTTGRGVLQEHREVGKILCEQGVVPADLGEKLQAMAGMRNVLVHLYWNVDHALLYQTVVGQVDTFERCIGHIFRYLDRLEARGE